MRHRSKVKRGAIVSLFCISIKTLCWRSTAGLLPFDHCEAFHIPAGVPQRKFLVPTAER
jgi:hypothetical protein